jgi:hypothetical protein
LVHLRDDEEEEGIEVGEDMALILKLEADRTTKTCSFTFFESARD